jgi:hypothetical protein
LSHNAVLPWWQTFRWWWTGWNGVAEVAQTTVKRLLHCRFWHTGKAIVQVLVENMSRYKCLFPGSNITCFIFYIHLRPIYWLSLVSVLNSAANSSVKHYRRPSCFV